MWLMYCIDTRKCSDSNICSTSSKTVAYAKALITASSCKCCYISTVLATVNIGVKGLCSSIAVKFCLKKRIEKCTCQCSLQDVGLPCCQAPSHLICMLSDPCQKCPPEHMRWRLHTTGARQTAVAMLQMPPCGMNHCIILMQMMQTQLTV